MNRPVLVLALVVLVSASTLASALRAPAVVPTSTLSPGTHAIGELNAQAMADPRLAERLQHFYADHGVNHPQRLDTHGLSAVSVAKHTLNVEVRNGRTVAQWVALAKADHLLSLPAPEMTGQVDLPTDVSRLADLAGHPLTADQLADVKAQYAALPADVATPFAALVHETANVYEAQAPIAAGIMQRMTASQGADISMNDQEREATLANAMALLGAENAFRASVKNVHFPTTQTHLFADPEGLVILGSTGDDTYERTGVLRDPILIVDPSGNDIYHTTGGSACPDLLTLVHDCNGLVVSTVLDLQGDDTYSYTGRPTDVEGSGSLGGIGILMDPLGNDVYKSYFIQPTGALGPFWAGAVGYIDAGAQGYGLAAVGILVDATGSDRYEADVTSANHDVWDLAQGFGNAGGVGIASDGSGDDAWLAYGFDTNTHGFQGLYPDGTGFFGGTGIMTDTGMSNDYYAAWDNATTTDFYADGFGAFGGTGIFYEDGGNDNYQGVEKATNSFIVPLLNCAFGTASFGGLGVFLEMGGNDHYFSDTWSHGAPRSNGQPVFGATKTMSEGFGGPAEGEGVFLDVSGDDGHFMQSHPEGQLNYGATYGRGILLSGGEGATGDTVGAYLDLGGADQYTGAAPSQDNGAWVTGIDLNAGEVPQVFP